MIIMYFPKMLLLSLYFQNLSFVRYSHQFFSHSLLGPLFTGMIKFLFCKRTYHFYLNIFYIPPNVIHGQRFMNLILPIRRLQLKPQIQLILHRASIIWQNLDLPPLEKRINSRGKREHSSSLVKETNLCHPLWCSINIQNNYTYFITPFVSSQ